MNNSLVAPLAARTLAEFVLRNAALFRWELQGFGMLRCYLPNDSRLQVWDRDFAVPGVTSIHDHPWDFQSLILAGELHNQRFIECRAWPGDPVSTHMKRTIVPGIGLRRVGDGEDEPARLVPRAAEVYTAGMVYRQAANEVHESRPVPGTVTLITRQRVGADLARSYYPVGTQWVSAEPRLAEPHERIAMVALALEKWFTPKEPPHAE